MEDDPQERDDPQAQGDQIAGYDLLEWMGDGVYGPIYKARQRSLDRAVVVKLLSREQGSDPARRAAFLAQARPLARVAHTHLVCALDAGEANGTAFFAMEWAEGDTIEDHMKGTSARLAERQTLRVGAKVARALEAMHKKLVLHKNVRPRSILVTRTGVPKLTDFGLASLESARDLADEGHPSTAWYVSPERVLGETDGDVTSDIYSLGATLFHMLSGRPPFDGATVDDVRTKHISAPPPSIRALLPSLKPETEAVLKRCLAKRPGDRFVNGGELAATLEAIVRSKRAPVVAKPKTVKAPVARRRRHRRAH